MFYATIERTGTEEDLELRVAFTTDPDGFVLESFVDDEPIVLTAEEKTWLRDGLIYGRIRYGKAYDGE